MKFSVRKGMSQSIFNRRNAPWLSFQLFLISVVLGLWSSSWIVFGVTFVGLVTIVIFLKPFATILAFALGIGTGIIIGLITGIFFSVTAQWVIGIIAGMAAIGVNITGMNWIRDVSDQE